MRVAWETATVPNKPLSWVYHSHQHHGRAVFEIVVLFTCSTPWKALSYNLVYSWSTQSSHFRDCVVIIASSKPINANNKSTLRCYGVLVYCWRSKSFRIRLSMKLKVFLQILKVFLNRSSVYVFHTMSHQPLLFLGKRRQDRRWTVSVAIFWLRENSKTRQRTTEGSSTSYVIRHTFVNFRKISFYVGNPGKWLALIN